MERSGIPFEDPEERPLSEDDETLLQMFYERMQRRAQAAPVDAPAKKEELGPDRQPSKKP